MHLQLNALPALAAALLFLQTSIAIPLTPETAHTPTPREAIAAAVSDEEGQIQARGECTLGLVCGEVKNSASSNSILKVTNDWGKRDSGAFKWISPGYSSATAMKDADGFFVESFCTATSGSTKWASGKWHKINDLQTVTVKIIC